MRIFKKSLSLLLAVCMLASMALVMTVASAEETKVHRPVVTEVVNSDPEIQVETNTYYFYMPEHWKNEYNDTYDGSNLDSCSAGIYWYGGDYKCDDYTGECAQGWPGYVIKEKESADDEAALNKTVTVYFPDDDETETYRIVTTIRGNSLKGLISIDSPLGKALLHHKVGDTVEVHVNKTTSYEVEIRSISAAADEEEDEIRKF